MKFKLSIKLSALLVFAALQSFAQNEKLNSMWFSTGGSYAAPGNQVKCSVLKSGAAQPTTIDQATGNFSNFCHVNERIVFWHCGRAAGSAAGSDVIYLVDALDRMRIDSITNASGAIKMAADGTVAAVIYGYGATDSFFRVFLLENLAKGAEYVDKEIPSEVGAIAYANGRFYVGFTRNDSGFIASYNFFGTQLLNKQLFSLGPKGAGVKEIYPAGNRIFILVEQMDMWPNPPKNAGIIEFTPSTGDVKFFKTNTAGVAAGLYNNLLYADFGQGLATFSFLTSNFDKNPWTTVMPSAAVINKLNGEVIAQETDYATIGALKIIDKDGLVRQSINTDISGKGLGLLYNSPPVSVPLFYVTGVDIPQFLPLNDSIIDYDGDKVAFSFKSGFPGTLQDNQGGYYTYEPPSGFKGQVVIEYSSRDGWGDSTSSKITINVGNSSVGEINTAAWQIKAYPNPATTFVNIAFLPALDNELEWNLLDIAGRKLALNPQKLADGQYRLNTDQLSSGVYRLTLSGASGMAIVPLIKH